MRILIDDGMQIKVGTGIGKYSLYLYKELKKHLEKKDSVELLQFDKGSSSKKQGRLKYLLYINSNKFKKKCEQYDVVHFTNYAMPFRKNRKTKYIVTIHDLASFIHPESLSTMYRLYNQFIVKLAIKNADQILTVSESVKKEIIERWPMANVKVAYPGLYSEFDSEAVLNQYESGLLGEISKRKFFLFVGTIETRKNLKIVIQSFIDMKKDNPGNGYKLVLAGRKGFGFEEYEKLINESKYKKDIIVTGYLSSNDVIKLYKEASAYIFPSVYEGFGSTQLECMVNHLPLILSKIPTNIEVSKAYGLFFDLEDKNFNEIKSHHYIISFDPKDKEECGLTGERAQQLGLTFAKKNFPGHQALVCTHTDGHNESGNIHVHIVINSLRKYDVPQEPYMEFDCESKAGYKHHLSTAYLAHLKQDVMDMCQKEGLHQVDLLSPAERKITEKEYWAQRRGQEKLDKLNQKMLEDQAWILPLIMQTSFYFYLIFVSGRTKTLFYYRVLVLLNL